MQLYYMVMKLLLQLQVRLNFIVRVIILVGFPFIEDQGVSCACRLFLYRSIKRMSISIFAG